MHLLRYCPCTFRRRRKSIAIRKKVIDPFQRRHNLSFILAARKSLFEEGYLNGAPLARVS
jgi:hypothetical protein